MLTINELKRLRRAGWRAAKPVLRRIDTQIELLQRMVQRVIDRREKIPTVADLKKFSDAYQVLRRQVVAGANDIAREINKGYV